MWGQNLLGRKASSAKRSSLAPSTGAIGSVSGSHPGATHQETPVKYTGQIESPSSMKGTVKLGDLGQATWSAKK